jgi:hypothetical protein
MENAMTQIFSLLHFLIMTAIVVIPLVIFLVLFNRFVKAVEKIAEK